MPAAVVPASTSIHSNPPNTLVIPQKYVLVFRFLFLCLLLVSCNSASSSLDPWFLSSCFLSCWCEAAICARWCRRFVTWLRVSVCCSHQQPPKQEHTERWNTPERLRRPRTSFVCFLNHYLQIFLCQILIDILFIENGCHAESILCVPTEITLFRSLYRKSNCLCLFVFPSSYSQKTLAWHYSFQLLSDSRSQKYSNCCV